MATQFSASAEHLLRKNMPSPGDSGHACARRQTLRDNPRLVRVRPTQPRSRLRRQLDPPVAAFGVIISVKHNDSSKPSASSPIHTLHQGQEEWPQYTAYDRPPLRLFPVLFSTDAADYEGDRFWDNLLDKSNTARMDWADTAYRSKANDEILGAKLVSQIRHKKPSRPAQPEIANILRLMAATR